ncbi:hypothetical protein GCM10027217_34970 [Pseudomaricurvus hydrocarbonicus]
MRGKGKIEKLGDEMRGKDKFEKLGDEMRGKDKFERRVASREILNKTRCETLVGGRGKSLALIFNTSN